MTALTNVFSAVLNICFPYTSRAEMTAAVKATVEEFTTPPLPPPTPFDPARITETIRSNQLKNPNPSSSLQDGETEHTSGLEVATVKGKTNGVNGSKKGATKDLVNGHKEDTLDSHSKSGPVDSTQFKDAELITAKTIDDHMYTAGCPPLDVFIRTSGVTRLSDFMLWQCHEDTHIFFLKCFWPEFDLWHFVPVLLEWQWRQKNKERESRSQTRIKFE